MESAPQKLRVLVVDDSAYNRQTITAMLVSLPDIEVVGDPVPLDSIGIPLVGGIKRLPVRFTPSARVT